MGMFSTVLLNCPHCGQDHEEQTKAGECDLSIKHLPLADLRDIAEVAHHAPYSCEHCGEKIDVVAFATATTVKYRDPDEDNYG